MPEHSSKARGEALAFDAMNELEDNKQLDGDYYDKSREVGGNKDDVNELVKRMPLGLLGSGLDDGSPTGHLSGLERVILANHSGEQCF